MAETYCKQCGALIIQDVGSNDARLPCPDWRRWRQTEESAALPQALQDWHQAIGEFMQRMGQIEGETYVFLQQMLPKNVYSKFSRSSFAARVNVIRAIAHSHLDAQKYVERLESALRHAEQLSKIRNIVAHNPLVMTVFAEQADSDHSDYTLFHAQKREEEKALTLDGIKAHSAEALSCAYSLFEINVELGAMLLPHD